MKRNDMSIENFPNIVTAACILHNVCEIQVNPLMRHGYMKFKAVNYNKLFLGV